MAFLCVLCATAGPVLAAALGERLVSADDHTRQDAMDELGTISSNDRQRAVASLVHTFKTADIDQRERALQALSKCGDDAKSALPVLKQALGDDFPLIRQMAVEALRGMGPMAIPALTAALHSDSGEVRSNAALALSRMAEQNKEQVTPALVQALQNQDPAVRQQAVHGLVLVGSSAIPPVMPMLKSNSPSTQLAALQVCAHIPSSDPSVSEQIVSLWSNGDSQLRTPAARALVKQGAAAVGAITPLLKNDSPALRRLAADTLGEIGRQAGHAVPALIDALKDSDADVRATAATALGKMGSTAAGAVPALREAAKDPDSTVSARATEALTDVTATHAEPVEKKRNLLENAIVIPMTGDAAAAPYPEKSSKPRKTVHAKTVKAKQVPVPDVKDQRKAPAPTPERIAKWISQLTSSTTPSAQEAQVNLIAAGGAGVPALTKALRNSDKVNTEMVLTILGDIGAQAKPAWLAVLEFVSDFSPNLRRAAAVALIKIDPATAQPTLAVMLQGTDPTPKPAAAEALGTLGADGTAAVPVLEEQLKSSDSDLRDAAAGALTQIGTPESMKAVEDYQAKETVRTAVSLIRDLAKDSNQVNYRAATALSKLGKPAVPAIQNALSDRSPIVRQGAAVALRQMGSVAVPATGALTAALDDSEPSVRHAAADALQAIGSPEALKPLGMYRLKAKVLDPWDALLKRVGFK